MRLLANLIFAAALTVGGTITARDMNGDVLDAVTLAMAPCNFVLWFLYLSAITWLERTIVRRGRDVWLTRTRVFAFVAAMTCTGAWFSILIPLNAVDLPGLGSTLPRNELIPLHAAGFLVANYCMILLLLLIFVSFTALIVPRSGPKPAAAVALLEAGPKSDSDRAAAELATERRILRQTVGTDIGVVTGIVGAVQLINRDVREALIAAGIGAGCLSLIYLIAWARARKSTRTA